jgi:hypothetical protein
VLGTALLLLWLLLWWLPLLGAGVMVAVLPAAGCEGRI